MKKHLPPLVALILLLCLLEILVGLGFVSAAVLPPPREVLTTLWREQVALTAATGESFLAAFLGFLLSGLVGFFLALSFSWQSWLRRAVLPFAVFFQTVPIIAIAPLLVIYFGFGFGTVLASSFLVSLFPVLAATLLGLQATDPGELELFRSLGATPLQTLLKLRLPRAVTSLYGGLKVSAGLAVIGTVAGEFVAGGGLGAVIDAARTQQRLDLVFAALVLLSVMGLLLIGVLQLLHSALNRHRPYSAHLKENSEDVFA